MTTRTVTIPQEDILSIRLLDAETRAATAEYRLFCTQLQQQRNAVVERWKTTYGVNDLSEAQIDFEKATITFTVGDEIGHSGSVSECGSSGGGNSNGADLSGDDHEPSVQPHDALHSSAGTDHDSGR